MIGFTMEIAGVTASVTAMYDTTREYCAGYLRDGIGDFSVVITPEDITLEREKSALEDALEGKAVRSLPDPYLETIALQRKLSEKLFDYNILLFHGSALAVDGKAYLFTAKSGTGKSTHARLWRQVLGDRVVMVNDDKPFLRITPEGIFVCGSPWNGKHGLGTKITVPLKAICILQQGRENAILPLPAAAALPYLIQQSNRPMDPGRMPKYMDLIDLLARNVAFYQLTCNMDPAAAVLSYTIMSGNSGCSHREV